MASDRGFVDYVADQMGGAPAISYRMMFGGHTFYANGKVVALVCDNQLFVKPTDAGRSYIGNVVEAPPYTGAKNSFLIEDKIDDKSWLSQLIVLTEKELPIPKKRTRKKKKTSRAKKE